MIVMEMKHNQNVDMFKCSHSTYRFLNRFKCKNSMYKSRLNHHRWEASYYMVSIKYQNKQQKIYWLLKTVQVVVLGAFDVLKISQSAFLEKKDTGSMNDLQWILLFKWNVFCVFQVFSGVCPKLIVQLFTLFLLVLLKDFFMLA